MGTLILNFTYITPHGDFAQIAGIPCVGIFDKMDEVKDLAANMQQCDVTDITIIQVVETATNKLLWWVDGYPHLLI